MLFLALSVGGVFESGAYEPYKQWVGLVGAALEFRVELNSYIKIVLGNFHRFDNIIVGRGSAYYKTGFLQNLPEFVVEFIAMAMTLLYFNLAVAAVHLCAFGDLTGISAQT